MKKIIAIAIMALMFSGCTTLTDAIKNPTLTRIYDTTKVIKQVYNNEIREIVIANFDLLPEKEQARLLKIDKEAQKVFNDIEKVEKIIK